MRQEPATPDRQVAEIAKRQHGVVTLEQLRSTGLSDSAVNRRVRAGRLFRIHRGVYAVGHAGLCREGRWMAAALACKGALSHRNAAVLWNLLPARQPESIDISVAGVGGRGRRRGIRVHRSRTLKPVHVTRRTGIPVTKPARTIADLRAASTAGRPGAVSPLELRQAIRQASVLGLRLDGSEATDRTRSELEHLFLELCHKHGVSDPEVNVRLDSMIVDFLWRDRRLVVETDGYRYHRGREAFENDRERDLKLRALGYEVLRLSYRQVAERPEEIARLLSETLSAR